MQCELVIARQRSGAALAEVMAVYQPIHKHVEGAAADSKEQRWDTAEAVLLAAGRSGQHQAATLSCKRAVEVRGGGAADGHRGGCAVDQPSFLRIRPIRPAT
jgi:hypothetical protein